MAVYTVIEQHDLAALVEDLGLDRLDAAHGVAQGSVNTHYVLETPCGRHLLRVDEVKTELEVKREIDLLLFLRRRGFPCPEPVADRRGRHHRELGGKPITVYRWIDGHVARAERLTLSQIEQVGALLGELHTIGKHYKKAIDNRFGFARLGRMWEQVRTKLPAHFQRIVRTVNEEFEHLAAYLDPKLPKGVIHGDVLPDSLLIEGERMVAVLPLEAACRGTFVFDLATAVNALCFVRDAYQLARFEALLSGYESRRGLSLAEWDAFPNELRLSALRFTVTRLKDFFLKPVDGKLRVEKDFREFYERLQVLRREREGGMERLLMAMATGYDYRKYQRVKSLEKGRST